MIKRRTGKPDGRASGGYGSMRLSAARVAGKDDAKEVATGFECSCALERFNDIHIGDVIEAFQVVEIKRSL